MEVKVSKKDVIWSYIALFFNIGAGLIVLPLILHMLSTEEIALNYLMLTFGSMVALIDFGFAPQFGRNITYVFSGAQDLKKEGLTESTGEEINYQLLKNLIDVAKRVYFYLSIIVLLILLTFGTAYIYYVTKGFTIVDNSFLIWVIYSISTYFNIYFYYYSSLLTGRGLIMESKKAMMLQKIVYIIISYALLLSGFGLLGVCIANLISPFVNRWLCYHYFYDNDLKIKLSQYISEKDEIKQLFSVIWYNAKKLGINFLGAYAITKFSMFVAGIYLSAADVSSYGLMIQVVTIATGVSTAFFTSYVPKISSLRVSGNRNNLIKTFAFSMDTFYLLFIICSFLIVLAGPTALKIIGSNATLPTDLILITFLLITLLENNHANFATYITTGNDVPFVTAALLSGFFICLLDFVVLQFTTLGLLGIVLVQGLVQLCYNNWYWPRSVCKDMGISYFSLLLIGFSETTIRLSLICRKRKNQHFK